MHHPTDMIIHTMAFVEPVMEHWLEREIAQWDHPIKDQSDDYERTLLPQSYILLLEKGFHSSHSNLLFSMFFMSTRKHYSIKYLPQQGQSFICQMISSTDAAWLKKKSMKHNNTSM